MLAIGSKLFFADRSLMKKRSAKIIPTAISPIPTKGKTHQSGNFSGSSDWTIFEKIIDGSKTLITIKVSPLTSLDLKICFRTKTAPANAMSKTCTSARALLERVLKNISDIHGHNLPNELILFSEPESLI